MKTTIARQQLSINVEVMNMLNQQIAKEAFASATYLAMASWCDQRGLVNSADFFYKQAEEERDHMIKIFKFINNCGGTALSPEVKAVSHDYDSLESIFEAALDHEVDVTTSINTILSKCRKVEDFASESLVNWFVVEQIEEEKTVRDILDIFRLMEGEPLKNIDEKIKAKK